MEYILQAIFQSGGSLDWQMISETNYNWEDIIEVALDYNGTNNIRDLDFNCLLYAIFELGKREFINNLQAELKKYRDNENYKNIVKKIDEIDFENNEIWDMWVNSLDNHFNLFVNDDEIVKFFYTELEDFINNINDNIGFCYLNIE